MDNLDRLRQARRRVVKAQRRIWLVQVAFWPAVAVGLIVAAFAAAGLMWRRRQAAALVDSLPVAPELRSKR
jgi:hypothetical protein